MASYTPNYNLKKPADADSYDIADANGNMDIIDGALNTLNNQIAQKTYNFSGLSNIAVVRFGNVCYLSSIVGQYSNSEAGGQITYSVGSTTGTLLIPSGYRPIVSCEIKDANQNKRITVVTDGSVTCSESISGAVLRFSGCWITNDAMPT